MQLYVVNIAMSLTPKEHCFVLVFFIKPGHHWFQVKGCEIEKWIYCVTDYKLESIVILLLLTEIYVLFRNVSFSDAICKYSTLTKRGETTKKNHYFVIKDEFE